MVEVALVILLSGAGFTVWALGLYAVANRAAHLSRYRRYRRSYPSADRGRVWKHSRG